VAWVSSGVPEQLTQLRELPLNARPPVIKRVGDLVHNNPALQQKIGGEARHGRLSGSRQAKELYQHCPAR
jgi:hypothetical protein